MELVFQENRTDYLETLLRETVNQEQTADLIVPDNAPDAQRIVDAYGTVLLQQQELGGNGIFISGMVQAGVLYLSPDGELRRIQTRIPFTLRRELDGEGEDWQLQCRCSLTGVDARILNSRKILIRAGISSRLWVSTPKIHTAYDIPEPAPTLQLKRKTLPLRLPVAMGERSFSLNEELELPSDLPEIRELLRCLYRVQILEQNAVGDKCVFKGSLAVHSLYADEEGSLHSHEWSVPFSQYVELEAAPEEWEGETYVSLVSVDTEPDGNIDSRRLLMSVDLLAQCVAYGTRNITYVEDAFCTDGDFIPQWEQTVLPGVLDRQQYRETAEGESEVEVDRVVDVWVYPRDCICHPMEQRVRMELPLQCNVLYYDPAGVLKGAQLSAVAAMEMALADSAVCQLAELQWGELFASGGTSLSVRIPLRLTMECTARHSIQSICSGEIAAQAPTQEKKPALLLRFTDEPEEIWEIAKSCKTTVESILKANDLTEARAPANALLLIPLC